GRANRWALDLRGRPLTQIDAVGGLWKWNRDPATTWVREFIDPLERTTTYTRDAQGYTLEEKLPDNNLRRYEYHPVYHGVTKFTDERTNATTYVYDAATGHLQSVENALHQFTVSNWAPDGLLRSVQDGRGTVTSYGYDAYRRRDRVIEAQNKPEL